MIVPDSIEPLIGYKWLKINQTGMLYSERSHSMWSLLSPFEARCEANMGWSYQARVWWEVNKGPPKPSKAERMELATNSSSPPVALANRESNWSPDSFTWIKKPKMVLPHPYAWSWEPNQSDHTAPYEECNCGIHMVYDWKDCEGYRHGYDKALVKIALWGKTVVGDKGARGEFAYPQEILSKTKDVDWKQIELAREKYGLKQPKPEPEPEQEAPPTWRESESGRKFRLW